MLLEVAVAVAVGGVAVRVVICGALSRQVRTSTKIGLDWGIGQNGA